MRLKAPELSTVYSTTVSGFC